ncbi:MAG TPA: FG-GAP repeat protein, partial [Verrucomicrobiae bacterium]|nr:FG-GAP repeat protein [Verrucomicrobiae bacterium]
MSKNQMSVLIQPFGNQLGSWPFRRTYSLFPLFVHWLLVLTWAQPGMAQIAGARLSSTFSSPLPGATRFFGLPADAVGTDRVIIGGASDTNAAYYHLFDLSGNLVTTYAITNPVPGPGQSFQSSAAAGLGADRVILGVTTGDSSSPRTTTGSAYLFSTNGTLLATFPNPTHDSGDSFGYRVAAVGNDGILIGAPTANMGATSSGAAYLFSTNGVLVATFHDPAPVFFGS